MQVGQRGVSQRLARLERAEGLELAGHVAALTQPEILAELSDSERLEVVRASARVDAWSASMRARTVAAIHRSALDDEGDGTQERQLAERRVAMELSLVLGVSFFVADRELDLALDLQDFPRVGRALARGDLDLAQARVILAGLRDLDRGLAPGNPVRFAHRARLLTGFLGPDDSPDRDDLDPEEPVTDACADGRPYPLFRELERPGVTLWSLPPAKLRAMVTREAARLDADFLAERAADAQSGRRVSYDSHPDGMTSFSVHTNAIHAAAAYGNVDEAARAARRAGDPRTLDQLRADIAVGRLTEGAYGTLVVRPGAASGASDLELAPSDGPLVHLTVAATTMLGLDDEPATLHGPRGPVPMPAALARELAHRRGARWRRLLYDPADGVARDLSRAYRPPPRMDEFVRARDGHQTRFPTSGATRLELDHVREYAHAAPASGGQTTAANLAAVGKRDHQLKTDRLVAVTGNANHRLTFRTPSGRQYPSYPVAHADIAGPAPPF